MRAIRFWFPAAAFLAAVLLSCTTGGGVEPIVIDLSNHRTPTPGIAPAPTEPPARYAAPTPTPRTLTTATAEEATPIAAHAPAEVPAPAARETPMAAGTGEAGADAASAERTVEKFEDAYNRHDLDALNASVASDVRVFEPPGRVRYSGLAQLRRELSRRFASDPLASRQASQRFTEGRFVVERETESGGGTSTSSIVVSEVRNGKIVQVWIFR